jgi:hypothetical protein
VASATNGTRTGGAAADLLSRWAFNQMLIGMATRKYSRSMRLPDGDLAGQAMRATTKSSVTPRFVAPSSPCGDRGGPYGWGWTRRPRRQARYLAKIPEHADRWLARA